MVVKLDSSTVRETRWYEYALRFLFGGLITAIAGIIAREFGPMVGGLFLAFPAIFPATATLAEKHAREKKQHKGYSGLRRGRQVAALEAIGAALGSIGLLPFAVLVWLFLPNRQTAVVLATGIFSWVLASVAIWQLRRKV